MTMQLSVFILMETDMWREYGCAKIFLF